MKGSKTSIWLSRIRRKSHIPGLYHIPSISLPICMVQILGLKREIRIASSQNGSIRLLRWNRNVIRNQCIQTYLDISTIPLTLFLSLPRYPSVSLCLSISFSLSISIITTTVWRKRFRLGLNIQSCWAEPWLSTMEIKVRKGKKRRRERKKQRNAVHFIRLSLPFSLWI